MSRWYRFELLSAQAAGRLDQLIAGQRGLYIGSAAELVETESVSRIPVPRGKSRDLSAAPAYRVQVLSGPDADLLGRLAGGGENLYIGRGDDLLTALNVTEVPPPVRAVADGASGRGTGAALDAQLRAADPAASSALAAFLRQQLPDVDDATVGRVLVALTKEPGLLASLSRHREPGIQAVAARLRNVFARAGVELIGQKRHLRRDPGPELG